MSPFLARLYAKLPIVRTLIAIRHAQNETMALLREQLRANAELLDLQLQAQPRHQEERRLLRYAAQVCSQGGEDGIIQEVFRRIGTTDRRFVEVGVGDGIENNTAFLLSLGWQGAWIDGDPAFTKALRGRTEFASALQSRVAMVTRENVAGLLKELQVPQRFDLLSLDIDQNTYHVWEGLKEFRPRVVVIEYNGAIPASVDWVVNYSPNRTWDGTQNVGASLKALERLGRTLGYSLVGCDPYGINAIFVAEELTVEHFQEPFTAENHHEPFRLAMARRRHHPADLLDRAETKN